MSLARPAGSLGRAFKPHRDRLIKDSVAFTRASLTFAASGAPGRASPAMIAALARWRWDARAARIRMQTLPATAPGKAAAIQTVQTLEAALAHLAASLQISDPTQARAASALARRQINAYTRLDGSLVGRLR